MLRAVSPRVRAARVSSATSRPITTMLVTVSSAKRPKITVASPPGPMRCMDSGSRRHSSRAMNVRVSCFSRGGARPSHRRLLRLFTKMRVVPVVGARW